MLPTTEESLDRLFWYWCHLYDSENYSEVKAVFQFVLEEDGVYHYYLSVENGKATYARGKHPHPDITVFSPVGTWFDVVSGRLSGTAGYLLKKYRIEGDRSFLKMMDRIFGKKFTERDTPGLKESIKDYEDPRKRVWKKPERVVVINGSPRKRKGFTFFYLSSLLKGMEKTGAAVDIVDLYDEKWDIRECRGCFTCWSDVEYVECVIRDSAGELLKSINKSYLAVMAFPLYADSMPGRVKTLLERNVKNLSPLFVPYRNVTRHPLKVQREGYTALFSVCGFPEIEMFDPLVSTFEGMARNGHRPLIAAILRPGAEFLYSSPPFRCELLKVLSALEEAGKELVERGRVSQNVLEAIQSDCGVKKEDWLQYANLHWYLRTRGKV